MGYSLLLRNLLRSKASSINLKASICRQIIEAKDPRYGTALCPGLISLMRSGGLFPATYACAALVNLSQFKEVIKTFLMKNGIAELCLQQLKSKDDDLILYTLMLLVHLTKLVHHRAEMKRIGMGRVLSEIMNASYSVIQYKSRVLTELCAVIGQLCNDEDTRLLMCNTYQVMECLKYIFENGGVYKRLMSKVLFALKQLCVNSLEN